MKLAALTLLLLPVTLRATPVDPQVREALSAMRDGSPATWTGPVLATERQALIESSVAFTKALAGQRVSGPKSCDRFNDLAGATASDLTKVLPLFTGTEAGVDQPLAVLAQARLQVELPAFELLARMVAENKEGGYGFLVRHKVECGYRDRAAVLAAFGTLAQKYKDFRIHALGTPGILGFEKQTELLLQLANRAETRHDRWQSLYLGVQAVGSMAAWKYLPKVAGPLFASAFGATGARLLTSKFFVVGATITSFYVEQKIWNAVDHAVVPSFVERTEENPFQMRMPGWEETLKDTEFLVGADLAQPHVYLSYLSAVKAEMALVFSRWRNAHDEQLKAAAQADPEFERQLAEALWLAREATFLKRQAPSVAARQLPLLIAKDWNLNVTCGADNWFGLSSIRFLIGARRISRALYSGLLPSPRAEIADLVYVNVGAVKKYGLKAEDARVRIDVPYKQPSERSAPFVAAAYEAPQVKVLFNFVTRFAASLERWNASGGQPLEFDPALPLRDQWTALNTLMRVREREPNLLSRRSEVLLVGERFRPMFERRMKLTEQIDARATLEETLAFLKSSNEDGVTGPEIARVETLRRDVGDAARSLGTTLGLDVQCSDQKYLTLQRCLTTVRRLSGYAKRHPGMRPEAHVLLVTDVLELGDNFELLRSPEEPRKMIWTVAVGFEMKDLDLAVRDRGWLVPSAPAL